MKFFKRLKLTCKYYKSLGKGPQPQKQPQRLSDLEIRPDVYAFLTCPQAIPTDKGNQKGESERVRQG